MTRYGIYPAVSPQVAKSKGQQRFSLLLFIGCINGCNSGLGWVVVRFIDSFMDDVTYVRYVDVCM
jgi:hypothetical protein